MSSEDPANLDARKGECPACKGRDLVLKDVNGIWICEKCAAKRFSSKVRKSIQEAFDRQQAQRQRESWRKRIDLARKGMAQYEDSKFQEALSTFRQYLAILEQHHGVSSGGLSPPIFDSTKEAGEILLIAGIYWDMSKVYDRMKGKEAEMRMALHKFIEFSIDRPHLIVASEAVRRYIGSDKCLHKEDFKNAQRLLRSRLAKCFVAGAVYGPVAPETRALREFRDKVLRPTRAGRAFIAAYYRASPGVALALARAPWLAAAARAALKPLVLAVTRRNR